MIRRVVYILLLLIALIANGQDPQFSRFYSNSLYLAPSFAGSAGKNRLALSYRSQWPEINKGYTTFSASFDHYFDKLNSGVGVLFLKDEAGSGNLRTTNIGLLYTYNIKLGPLLNLRPGMHFLYTERGIDFEKLLWGDQMSAAGNAPASAEVPPFNRVGDIDFASSLLLFSDRFWTGFSVDHLLAPNQSLYSEEYDEANLAQIPIKYQFFGGYKHVVKETLLRPKPTILQIAYLYKQQADFKQLDLGFYWHYDPLVLGVWYRGVPVVNSFKYNDALILLIGLKTEQFNIGYSYDFTMSKLITSTGGSHEISLSFSFGKPKKRKRSKKMVPCPDF